MTNVFACELSRQYRPEDTTFIGASWTDDFALAHKFALVGATTLKPPGEAREQQIEAQRSLGQPAVIRATITPDTIISAVHESGNTWLFRQREFVVDPRRLRPDDLHMVTTDELNLISQQQQQVTQPSTTTITPFTIQEQQRCVKR